MRKKKRRKRRRIWSKATDSAWIVIVAAIYSLLLIRKTLYSIQKFKPV